MEKNLPDDAPRKFLEPHSTALKEIFYAALQEMNNSLSVLTVKPNKRLRPTMFHNIVTEKAKAYFREMKDVRIVEKYDSPIFSFGEELMVRFKKLSKEKLLSSNLPTHRNNALLGMQGTLFPEYHKKSLIEIGYVIDTIWDDFEMLIVVGRRENEVRTIFEIIGTESTEYKSITAKEIQPEIKEEKQLKIKRK